ncbi:cytoplasmic protein [Psychrobacillus sp. L4]|uniref:cytoplasmic protein n=1 Tax=Psychrobacillus sp. L4 TaxID=3236892 RepID=UPI0036F3B975
MFFRRKSYIMKKEFVATFNELFNEINLPNQLKNGSRFVGRWMLGADDDKIEIFAIWEYDSYEDYVRIESNIRNDSEHVNRVLGWYNHHGGKEFVQNTF